MFNRKGKLHPRYKVKHKELSKRKMSLSRGGTGIPYENNQYTHEYTSYLKNQIRNRDNYTCQLCKITEIDYGKILDIHHIDYNKENCQEDNLITLCHKCNIKVNKNRNYWKLYFIESLQRRKHYETVII
ncbi:MAG: hypothetical protein JW924_03120 [Fusobacteriaceae bacterium]|nr:hypothetical protein [Fusobacteriaceae bacterium]